MVKLEEMEDEPLASYREAVRRRLQELMLRDGHPPGHPLVLATGLHLDMSTASEAAVNYSAPSPAHFYRGCDLFYSAGVRPESPCEPPLEHKLAVRLPISAKVTI